MSTAEIVEDFPPPQILKAISDGRMSLPSDPLKRAVYAAQLGRYRLVQENKQKVETSAHHNSMQSGTDGNGNATDANRMADAGDKKVKNNLANLGDDDAAKVREARMYADIDAERLAALPPQQRISAIINMAPMEWLALYRGTNQEKHDRLMSGLTAQQKELLESLDRPQAVVNDELMQGKLLRAIYSERQLDEVMTDFWFNHFNVFIGKGPDSYLITSYERDGIRPHALGKFKDLLVATAKSPAMLFYLDNAESIGPNSEAAQGGFRKNDQYGRKKKGYQNRPHQQKKPTRGLNENYAREIMELHTLGVDGGYTQKDVTELAKVLTGWTLKRDMPGKQGAYGSGYEFNERLHEPGKKVVLGKTFKEDGEKEGLKALDMLAHHPSTARFVSKKLAMRFVSDDPPQSLIDRMADTFRHKDGDIREVLRTMFKSPELWAPEAYRAKVKTPLEFVVSAVRAGNVDVSNAMPLAQFLNRMGMPLYGMQPPTGYSMKAEAWVNSAALLNRMNFALALGANKLNGMKFDLLGVLGANDAPQDPEAALPIFEQAILDGDISKETHQTILRQISDSDIVAKTAQQLSAGAATTANRFDPENQSSISSGKSRPATTQLEMHNHEAVVNKLNLIAGLIMGSPEFQRR